VEQRGRFVGVLDELIVSRGVKVHIEQDF